jgi:hypothetical protein
MNLGLVVLSAENEVFFQASLVTSESLSTTFTLPTAGAYPIGVLHINLVEPGLMQRAALRQQRDEVEPTVFQLRESLTAS